MGIRISKATLQELVPQLVLPDYVPDVVQSLVSDLTQIKGGEIFIAKNFDEAVQAHNQGCGVAFVEGEDFQVEEYGVVVTQLDELLKSFVKYWYAQLDTKIIVVSGAGSVAVASEVITTILLNHSLGHYTASDSLSVRDLFCSFCNVKTSHKWALLSLGLLELHWQDVYACINPEVVLLTGCTQAEFEAVNAKVASDVMMVVPDFLDTGSRRHLAKYGCAPESDVSISEVISTGIDPVKLKVELGENSFDVDSNLIGVEHISSLAASLLVASNIEPNLSHEELVSAVSKYIPAKHGPRLYKLGDGRKVVCDVGEFYSASIPGFTDTYTGELAKSEDIALVLGDLNIGTEAEYKSLGKQLSLNPPMCIAYVGSYFELVTQAVSNAGVPVFDCSSPEVAAHTVGKIAFSVLYIRGANQDLEKVLETLIYSYGESIEIPVSTIGQSVGPENDK